MANSIQKGNADVWFLLNCIATKCRIQILNILVKYLCKRIYHEMNILWTFALKIILVSDIIWYIELTIGPQRNRNISKCERIQYQ